MRMFRLFSTPQFKKKKIPRALFSSRRRLSKKFFKNISIFLFVKKKKKIKLKKKKRIRDSCRKRN